VALILRVGGIVFNDLKDTRADIKISGVRSTSPDLSFEFFDPLGLLFGFGPVGVELNERFACLCPRETADHIRIRGLPPRANAVVTADQERFGLFVALLVGVMTTYYFSYSDFESGFGYLFGVPGMSRPCQTIAL